MSDRSAHAREAPPDQRLRQNNFDLLRFVFAFAVFLVHAHALSGAQELAVFSRYLSSDIAVKSFFVSTSLPKILSKYPAKLLEFIRR